LINLYHPEARARRRETVSTNEHKDLESILLCAALNNNADAAAQMAEARGDNDRVVQYLKASSPAFDESNLTSPYSVALGRLIANHGPRSAFDRMALDMTQVPLRTRFIVSGASIAGDEVAEGQPKPIRRLVTTNLDTEVSKFAATVAITLEALKESPEFAARVLASTLPEAVGRATDAWFLGKLAAEESGESSGEANPSWALVLNDLEELMRLVQVGSSSKLYYIMQPRAAKYLARIA
jgi:hypothetical protein